MSTTLAAAVLVYPGCIVAEVLEAATRIRRSGREVVFVSLDDAPFRDESGLLITPDARIDGLDPKQFAALVVAGGNPDSIVGEADVRSLVTAIAGNALVAGICAGTVVLADAGVLDGRLITHNYRDPWAPPEVQDFVAPMWRGAIVEPDLSVGVVHDGNVITALPEASTEFALAVTGVLDEHTPS